MPSSLSIEKSVVLGSKAFVLQNDFIRTVVAPELGGRILSLIYKPTETEFVWHSPEEALANKKTDGELNASGFFDCIPTCDPCNFKGKRLPVGGEILSIPWKIRKAERTRDHVKISMEARCRIYPLLVRKEVSLEDKRSVLVLRYEVHNLSGDSLEYHYSAHNTISVSPQFRIFLPKEVTKLKLGYTGRFGKAGDEISWPWAVDKKGNRIDLSKVSDACEKTMENLYTSKLSERWCAAVNQSRQEAIGFTWEGEALQYLNVCTNYGGWRDYYFIALEPVTGRPDNLEVAVNKWKKDYAVTAPEGTATWTEKIVLAHNIKTVRKIENDEIIE
jgi:galactose mutarotase-like enzyme